MVNKADNTKVLSQKDWIQFGLEILYAEGENSLTIDRLCRKAKITKGSFYHHFNNIKGYRERLLDFWLKENSENVINRIEKDFRLVNVQFKIKRLAVLTSELLKKPEKSIRAWAMHSGTVKKIVKKADSIRLNYIKHLLDEDGQANSELKAKGLYALFIGGMMVIPEIPRSELVELYSQVIAKNKK